MKIEWNVVVYPSTVLYQLVALLDVRGLLMMMNESLRAGNPSETRDLTPALRGDYETCYIAPKTLNLNLVSLCKGWTLSQ